MTNKPYNFHCTALNVIKDGRAFGILITGASGSGKSRLALQILHEKTMDWDAVHLIADDQVLLESVGGALIAKTPPKIAGKIELRGYGIIENLSHASDVPVYLIAELTEIGAMERMPELQFNQLHGHEIRHINLPLRDYYHAQLILNYTINEFFH